MKKPSHIKHKKKPQLDVFLGYLLGIYLKRLDYKVDLSTKKSMIEAVPESNKHENAVTRK